MLSTHRRSDGSAWLLLVYRVPGEPSRVRVGVWRELKRLGGLYLQSACCILPARPGVHEAGGTSTLLCLPAQPQGADHELVSAFCDLASKEYPPPTPRGG